MTKVLIADDNTDSAYGLSQLIEKCWGLPGDELKIVVAHTLADALREGVDANVTILDLEFPDSTAEETIPHINRFPPPVIVLTGHGDDNLSALCMQAGAAHVFIKGSLMGFIPTFFKALQLDVIRRAEERHATQ